MTKIGKNSGNNSNTELKLSSSQRRYDDQFFDPREDQGPFFGGSSVTVKTKPGHVFGLPNRRTRVGPAGGKGRTI